MPECRKPIKCWDNTLRPCLRPEGHTPNLCNPFGTDHPLDKKNSEDARINNTLALFEDVLNAAGLQRKVPKEVA